MTDEELREIRERWKDPEHREWLEGGEQDVARLLAEVDRLRGDLARCHQGWAHELDESAYRATLRSND